MLRYSSKGSTVVVPDAFAPRSDLAAQAAMSAQHQSF